MIGRVLARRWLAALLLLLSVAVVAGGAWTAVAEREVESGVRVVNPGGTAGTALVVYHPGLSGFMPEMVNAFATGLASCGWRVELTTASSEAPADVSGYDLLALGAPTYWWSPALPVRRYVGRLPDLGSKPVVLVVTASGQPGRSRSVLEGEVREKGGDVVASVPLTKWKPNVQEDSRPNEAVARGIARSTGEEVGSEAR